MIGTRKRDSVICVEIGLGRDFWDGISGISSGMRILSQQPPSQGSQDIVGMYDKEVLPLNVGIGILAITLD